jgi:hypothetical protein
MPTSRPSVTPTMVRPWPHPHSDQRCDVHLTLFVQRTVPISPSYGHTQSKSFWFPDEPAFGGPDACPVAWPHTEAIRTTITSPNQQPHRVAFTGMPTVILIRLKKHRPLSWWCPLVCPEPGSQWQPDAGADTKAYRQPNAAPNSGTEPCVISSSLGDAPGQPDDCSQLAYPLPADPKREP